MKNLKLIFCILVIVVFVGCSEPKIDASTDESLKASVEKVKKSLPESEKKEFDEAMQMIAFSQIDIKKLIAQGTPGTGNLEEKVRHSLDGKTGEQVIAEAERIREERKERERQQAIEEIHELELKRAKSESAREELKKFQVVRSRFYLRKEKYVGNQPIIELTVKNGTNQAVSRAYFEGTIASPGRSVPWYKDSFNYSISGGLEPGEKANWNLAPNMFSDWGKVDAPKDAIFTVTVEQLDGPDGEPIFSTREFNEYERERLAELKKKYEIE